MKKKFVLIGAAGYIAPRHMKAIKDIGGDLIAIHDISDSVGVIDSYFPNALFSTNFEEIKQIFSNNQIDYLVVCSPNYLHKEHIIFGLENGVDVICEKPIVIHSQDLDELSEIEKKFQKKVYTILQLRYHPAIISLRDEINSIKGESYQVNLEYITVRGPWYDHSWKGNSDQSGGIAINIGIHLFDMLTWIFGDMKESIVETYSKNLAKGKLILEKAEINWKLSTDASEIPESIRSKNQRTYRMIEVNGKEIEFSDGFTDLHTVCYREIIAGNGFGIADARESIRISNKINIK